MNRSGMFPICSGYWDENDMFHPSTVTELTKCCINNCSDRLKYCNNLCTKYKKNSEYYDRCKFTCYIQNRDCIETCRLSSPYVYPENTYTKCATKYGCKSEQDENNIKCINDKKQEIYNCCLDNCIPAHNLDCNENCTFLQDLTIDLDTSESPLDNSSFQLSDIKITDKKSCLMIIILSVFFITSSVIILVLMYIL